MLLSHKDVQPSKMNHAGLSSIAASSEPAETVFELEALLGRASQQMRKISRDFSLS